MQKRILPLTLLLFVVSLFNLVPLAQAQYRASLRGVTTDPQGAIVQGAKVTLLNTDTNFSMTATTDAAGIYVFNALPAANYRVVVEHPGFKKKVLDKVAIIPDQLNALNLQLEVGQVQETVTVSETTQTLDTETATLAATVTAKEVANMPSFGRDVFKLMSLTPGVNADNAVASNSASKMPGTQGPGGTGGSDGIFSTENGPQASAGGQQYENNGYSVDGVSTTSAVWGGTTVITPTQEAVQDVKVIANSYDSEFGRFSGTQVQVTSKSGTNNVHGSAFLTRHSPGLNAYQQWGGFGQNNYRDTNLYSQYGGSVGAPIWKNKIFGFFAWETNRGSNSNPGQGWYETDDFINSVSSNSTAAKFLNITGSRPKATSMNSNLTCGDAGLVEGVNCRAITGKGLDIGRPLTIGLGKQDLSYLNSSNPGLGGDGTGAASNLDGVADIVSYNINSPSSFNKNQYVGRVDANLTPSDRLAGSLYWIPQTTDSFNGTRPYDAFHHSQVNNSFSLIYNHTFSPTLVNEARFNAAGWRWNEIKTNPQYLYGLPNDSIDGTGSITINSFGPNVGSILDQWTYSYKDVATKVAGRHTIKFGGELTRLYYLNECVGCAVPGYEFFNIWDFLNDAPHREGWVTYDPHTGKPSAGRQDDRENLWGLFVQDDLRLRRNLTLNLGLRWSYFGSLYDKGGNMYVAHPGAGSAYLTGLTVTKGNGWTPEKGNFGPQIGFSWSPSAMKDKMVVRGGYGISYNQFELAVTAGNLGGNPGSTVGAWDSFDTPTGSNSKIFYSVSPDPKTSNFPSNPAYAFSFGSNGLPVGQSVGVNIFPNTLPTILVHHYSLDTQYDLGQNWVVSLGYQGSASRNLVFPSNTNAYAVANGAALNSSISGGTHDGSNGYGNYNAFLAEVKHNFSHGFLADAQYTWSKSMDTSSGPYYQLPFINPKGNYAASDFNVPQSFKLFGLYSPTIFKGQNNLLEKTLGGWTLSGIFNAHSGYPWSPYFPVSGSYYCSGCGYGWMYPAAYRGGAGTSTSNDAFKTGSNYSQGGTAYFTAPAFTNGATPTMGVHRNSLKGPGYRSIDATLVKAFGLPRLPGIGETAKFEFRIDAYNLFNNLNIAGGSGNVESGHIINDVTSPNFGKSNAAYGGRVVTLGARFNF